MAQAVQTVRDWRAVAERGPLPGAENPSQAIWAGYTYAEAVTAIESVREILPPLELDVAERFLDGYPLNVALFRDIARSAFARIACWIEAGMPSRDRWSLA